MARIAEIAQVCKSKNAGPFELTIDVVFGSREMYDRVKATGVLNAALIARLYGISENQVLFTPYPAGNAFKATIPRLVAASTSTLSTPTPARPTTFNLVARAITSDVTFVAERTIRPS